MATPTGFKPIGNGLRAWVRLGNTLKTKRFPKTASVAEIQRWRSDAKQEIKASAAYRLYAISNGRWGKGLRISRIPRAEHGWCYVYFVKAGQHVKVGSAVNIRQRLASIRTSSPDTIELMAVCPAHRDVEAAIHRHFWRDRVRAEWYSPGPEMLMFIHKVRAGWNPILLLMGDDAVAHVIDADSSESPSP